SVVYVVDCFAFLFFFSSRRRHTRSKRDWSSDVCSSDLVAHVRHVLLGQDQQPGRWLGAAGVGAQRAQVHPPAARVPTGGRGAQRSEERRVGKECRSTGSPDQGKNTRRRRIVPEAVRTEW